MELFNAALEKSVLSSLLMSPSAEVFEDMMFTCKQEYFYFPDHQNIFLAIKALSENNLPIDEEFLKRELDKHNCFNESVMLDIMMATPITNIEPYVKILKEFRLKHALLELSIDIKKRVESDEGIADIEKHIETSLMRNDDAMGVSEPISMAESIASLDTMVMPPKLSLGIKEIDRVLCGGIESSQLVHIGGQQNVGKTTLTRQILANISNSHKSLFFTFEMPSWKIANTLKNKKFNRKNFFIVDRKMMTPDIVDVARMIRRWHRKHNIRFVMIDSKMKLQHTSYKGHSESDRIGDIDAILAALTVELDIVIMVITQLSKTDQKEGTMSGLGSVKSDYEADLQIMLTKGEGNEIGFQVKKNRQDVLFDKIPLWFDKDKLEFSDVRPVVVLYEKQYDGNMYSKSNTKIRIDDHNKSYETKSDIVKMPVFL